MKIRTLQRPRRREVLRVLGSVPWLMSLPALGASPFPSRTVTMMCPYQAGGIVDTTDRRLAQSLGALWNVSVIVDNRPGAGGNLAAGIVARATPDGYTQLVTLYEGLIISGAGKLNLGFDPIEDLTPVALVGDVELWFLVNPKLPYKTMAEFLDYGKKHPGTINFGTIGIGSGQHLGLEQINAQTGIGLVHLPYKGVQKDVDLMAGSIDATFSSRLSTAQHVKDGQMRLLAVVGNRRSALYPDIPTFADVGLGDVIVPYAMGAFVSVKTPADIVASLNRDIIKVLHEPAIEERFASEGVTVGNLTPDELKARMRREVGVIQQVIVKNNVKLE